MMIDVRPRQTEANPLHRDAVVSLRPPAQGTLMPVSAVEVMPIGPTVEWLPATAELATLDIGTAFLREAIARAGEVVERYPQSANAHINLAQAYWHASDMDAASRHCEIALSIDRESYVAALLLARIREVQGRSEDASALYRRVNAKYPKDPAALLGIADGDIRRGDFSAAIGHLEVALAIDPAASVARFYLGMVLLRVGRGNDSVAQLRRGVHTDPRSPVLHHALGLAYWSLGSRRKAENQFRTALHLVPSYVPAVRSLGQLLILQKKASEALPVLQRYLALNSDNEGVRDLLGWALFEQGDYRHSIEHLKIAFTLLERQRAESPELARVANNIGVAYARQRDLRNAEGWFERAIAHERDQTEANHNIAKLYVETKREDRAIRVLEAFRQRGDDRAETGVLLALAKMNQGEVVGAIAELNDVTKRPDAPPAAYSMLGTMLADEVDEITSAISVLREGASRFPDNQLVGNNLAYALLLDGRVGEAREVLEKYPEAETNDIYLRATWGLLHLREDDLEGGIRGYREAQGWAQAQGLKELANQAKQKMHLEVARLHLRRGDRDAAVREVRLGLSIAGKPAYRRSLTEIQRSLRGDEK